MLHAVTVRNMKFSSNISNSDSAKCLVTQSYLLLELFKIKIIY